MNYSPKFTAAEVSYEPKFNPTPNEFLGTEALDFLATEDDKKLQLHDGAGYTTKFE